MTRGTTAPKSLITALVVVLLLVPAAAIVVQSSSVEITSGEVVKGSAGNLALVALLGVALVAAGFAVRRF